MNRFAHAGVHPRPGSWTGNNMNIYISQCMEQAYLTKNVSALWACWTDVSIHNTKSKSGDVAASRRCPFYGVHQVCLRWVVGTTYVMIVLASCLVSLHAIILKSALVPVYRCNCKMEVSGRYALKSLLTALIKTAQQMQTASLEQRVF